MSTKRSVRLPPEKLTACVVCGSKQHPQHCSLCGEKIYCSKECQKKDWVEGGHKQQCGRFERLDVEAIYPFLCGIARFCHNTSIMRYGPHPAQCHKIVNSPNLGVSPVSVPGVRGKALLVKLGEPISPDDVTSPKWWPTASNAQERQRMYRRIMYSGHALIMHFAVAFALLAEVYAEDRVRLRYRSAPIADFGIAKGLFRAIEADRLAFQLPDGSFIKGQDQEDHYWIYFTTAKGEHLILDFALYPFNVGLSALTDPYFTNPPANAMGACPAYFRNREMRRELNLPADRELHHERARFSVLRDKSLHGPVEQPDTMLSQTKVYFAFLEKAAGRGLTVEEKGLVPSWLHDAAAMVDEAMFEKRYKTWPKEAQLVIEDEDLEEDARQTSPRNPARR